jgi:hypothetical protein
MSYLERVYVSDTSPTGLRWAEDIRLGFGNSVLRASKGDIAGSEDVRYYEVGICGKKFWCHRIVWEKVHGDIPDGMKVDHKDRNGKNNAISNLRLVTQKINSRNLKLSVRNTSGVRGVTLLSSKKLWRAHWITLQGKSKAKHFSIAKLGDAGAFRQAVEHREKEIKLMNLEGAGYEGVGICA